MKFTDLILISTAIFTALIAGLFFSFSVSVSLGLGKLGDKEYLNAMQQINSEVQNPLFFLCFFGSLVMLCFSTFYYKNNSYFPSLLGSFIFYALGVFLVTILINVPLNNELDNFDITNATEITATKMRKTFENKWNFWNNIRTVSSIFSLFFVIFTCFYKSK